MAVDVFDFVFVKCSLTEVGNEQLPNAGRTERPHWIDAAVPIIERPDNAHALGVRGEHSEAHSVDTVDRAELRAEFVIDAEFVSLAEEINVHFTQCGQE